MKEHSGQDQDMNAAGSSAPASPTAPTPVRRSRLQFWLLVGLFFVPLAASFLLYYAGDGWRPAGSTNHGELILPARTLPAIALPTPEGGATSQEFLRGSWSLVFLGEGMCDEHCRTALTDMRQVRLALNDDQSRVQRVFLYRGACCDEGWFAAEQQGLVRAATDGPGGAELQAQFPGAPGSTYLVDPLGNLMMQYGPGAPARGMLDDLKKLLRLSHIG